MLKYVKIFYILKGGEQMEELANKMLVYRAKHRLSQKEFAELVGLSTMTVNSIESGRQTPSALTKTKIMLVLDKEVDK